MKVIKIKFAALFWFALGTSAFAINPSDYKHLLRDDKAKCGFYLARLSSEFTGRRITEDLDTKKLKQSLIDFDPAKERVVAVGAPPDFVSRRKLRTEISRALEAAGYPAAKFTTIRHIGDYIESKVGVFAIVPGKGMTRIAGLDQADVATALNGPQLKALLDGGGSIVISGAPLIGPSRQKMKANVQTRLDQVAREEGLAVEERMIQVRSKAQVWARAFLESPKKAYLDAWYRFRSIFPYGEDKVTPTDGEMKSTGQKVTMHTLFSAISFLIKGEPMEILIPMTVVNGANSAGTGTYRSTLGNWMSRNGDSYALRTLKGIMLSSFFTLDLYLARNAFDSNVMKSMVEFSGWSNFVAASWVSVLFQALWRTPVSSVLHSWERWKSGNGDPNASAYARNVAGNAEKFMTYMMTQLYMLSIVVKSSFFKVIWESGHGPRFLPGAEDVHGQMGQTLLMNFNVGHFAMAVVGVGAFLLRNQYKHFDKVVPSINWLDKLETRGYQGVVSLFKRSPKAEDTKP